ncbi:hypothetical protein [Phyllobacterium lublinensis]|nr:hypothetical protein [Phyllobacterium sp. 2063]
MDKAVMAAIRRFPFQGMRSRNALPVTKSSVIYTPTSPTQR